MEIIKKPWFNSLEPAEILDAFGDIQPRPIACCNWASDYPYAPTASFRMFHNGEYLFVRYDVTEDCTAARVAEDNGEVWTDSCVEFFISTDDKGYYNFETNCIGKLLLGFRCKDKEPAMAPKSVLDSVKRFSSLPCSVFDERHEAQPWWLIIAIPASALFIHKFHSWDGIKAKANVYKCGDNLSKPHFLSWNPINYPTPNFHLPEFFGNLELE